MFMNYYSDYEDELKMLFKVIFQKTDDQLRLIGASDSGACVCVCLIIQESSLFSIIKINPINHHFIR